MKKINSQQNFPEMEQDILEFWEKNKVFKKSLRRTKKGLPAGRQGPRFVFYEGPPTANAKPGIHHVLARVFKDLIPRYKTMQGFYVERKAGWDTHGLPVELEIEKKLGIKVKPEIEKYGIGKFNKKCKESVWKYKEEWDKLTKRIGFWIDLENPYITYENDYIETLWWIIKQVYERGLLYKGHRVVPYCPRCGTALSSHEVALGYKNIEERSLTIKFKLIKGQKIGNFNVDDNTHILAWTTTPWTLPGNVALAIGGDIDYSILELRTSLHRGISDGEMILTPGYYIIATDLISEITKEGNYFTGKSQNIKGKDLIGLEYDPLFPEVIKGDDENAKNAFKIYPADFVSTEEGTGVVHIAVMYGQEDYELGEKVGLPKVHSVNLDGTFNERVPQWKGKFVKDVDDEIIKDLKKRNLLFRTEMYAHDYPFCWRCDTPLIYYAKTSWFIRMSALKEDLIRNNEKINWVPAHIKDGRFGEWLREIKDWNLSRERYWGTPLPIWQCKKCEEKTIIGGLNELAKLSSRGNRYIILRHGQAFSNKHHIISSDSNNKKNNLTEEGKRQIQEFIKKFEKEKIDFIFSSDFIRTRETSEILSKSLGLKVHYDKRLRELNHGIFDGKNVSQYHAYFEKPIECFTKKVPKGETLNALKKRMMGFIKWLDKKYQNKTILIVGHGDPLWMLEGGMKNLSNERILKIRKNYLRTGQFRKLNFQNLPYDENGNLDLHRPYVDEIKIKCPKCGGVAMRVFEVVDCWFDSGSMPFAQWHWPFENNKKFNEQFPADYISEAIDQTRGWFYTLHAVSTLIRNSLCFKNVICLGHVLDKEGKKMSKSRGNVIEPSEVIDKFGVDALRWYFFTINPPGEPKLFDIKDVEEKFRKFILTFWNTYIFYKTYADKSKVKSQKSKVKSILDRWIFSKLNNLIKEVTERLDSYDVTTAARAIDEFVDDLSNWYVRRSRRRFSKPENKKDYQATSSVLYLVLSELSKLAAPFVPFISEFIYREIAARNSVHLCDYPKANKRLINPELEEKMKRVREIVALALAERAKAGIKVRQPLKKLKVKSQKLKVEKELIELIEEEVNVKEVVFDSKIKSAVLLDKKITPELREEGLVREFIRQVQGMRKEGGFIHVDKIILGYQASKELQKIIEKWQDFVKKEVIAKEISRKIPEKVDLEKRGKIDGKEIKIGIKKS